TSLPGGSDLASTVSSFRPPHIFSTSRGLNFKGYKGMLLVACCVLYPNQRATCNEQHATMTNGHIKHFVLDTNVLLHNPNALFMFKDNEVIIPFDVIEELDKFKAGTDDLGRNARTVIRHLDVLREKGNLSQGVPLEQTGGRLRVIL